MEYVKEIMDIVAEQAYEQLKHNLEHVNTKELGEVVDMIKDCSEACYYCSVVDAMEEANKEEEKRRYYVPHADWTSMTPLDHDDWEHHTSGRMYYDYREPSHHIPYHDFNEPVARDLREGRSPLTRRMYMEAKTQHQGKQVQLQELEKYMGELSQDITEMIADASPEEKQMLHKKLAALTNKVELLSTTQNV